MTGGREFETNIRRARAGFAAGAATAVILFALVAIIFSASVKRYGNGAFPEPLERPILWLIMTLGFSTSFVVGMFIFGIPCWALLDRLKWRSFIHAIGAGVLIPACIQITTGFLLGDGLSTSQIEQHFGKMVSVGGFLFSPQFVSQIAMSCLFWGGVGAGVALMVWRVAYRRVPRA